MIWVAMLLGALVALWIGSLLIAAVSEFLSWITSRNV